MPADHADAALPPEQWDRLLWLGHWHALLPTLSASLAAAPGVTPPATLADALAVASQANQLALLARQREALLLVDRLESAGVAPVLGSGWALGLRYLARAELRRHLP